MEDIIMNKRNLLDDIERKIDDGIYNLPTLKNILSEILYSDSLDWEGTHLIADKALLAYINDEGVKNIFNEIPKWYA